MHTLAKRSLNVIAVTLLLALALQPFVAEPPAISGVRAKKTGLAIQTQPAYGEMPLYFVENAGQVDDRVAYYLQGSDKNIYFENAGLTLVLQGSHQPGSAPHAQDLNHESSLINES